MARLVDVQERITATDQRLAEIGSELVRLAQQDITDADVAAALTEFDTLWSTLSPREQVRVVSLLIERLDYDGTVGTIDISFLPAGIKILAAEVAQHEETAA